MCCLRIMKCCFPSHSSSQTDPVSYPRAAFWFSAPQVDLAKAQFLMHENQLDAAVSVLRGFETREKGLKARAANDLSCIYILEGEGRISHTHLTWLIPCSKSRSLHIDRSFLLQNKLWLNFWSLHSFFTFALGLSVEYLFRHSTILSCRQHGRGFELPGASSGGGQVLLHGARELRQRPHVEGKPGSCQDQVRRGFGEPANATFSLLAANSSVSS